MAKSFKVETLGDLKAHGKGLYAHCTALYSGHGAKLDLDMLIEKFGSDYVFINDKRIAAACVCKQCGHKGAEIRLTVDSADRAAQPRR